jgi:hypothetical protein
MKHRKSKPVKTPPRHLLIRYGGLGDSLFLTAVAHQLRKTGLFVDIAIPAHHVPMMQNNTDIERVYPLHRIGPWSRSQAGPVNLVKTETGALMPIECIIPQYETGSVPRQVRYTDYFRIIEGNGCHPSAETGNSDYVNTYDLHLSWAGIDPEMVPDSEKRPFYSPTSDELDWAENVLKGVNHPIILWQPHASAPARSYYRAVENAQAVEKKIGGFHLLWDKGLNKWMHHTGAIDYGDMNPLRATAALIAKADLLVSADTFVSHLAEAVGTKHLTWYSTVSAWTRSKYYKHEITFDLHPAGADKLMPCKCHVITDARCPIVEKEALAAISDKDKAFLNTLPPQVRQQLKLPPEPFPIPEGVEARRDLHPDTIGAFAQSIAQTYNIARHAEPACIKGFHLAAEVLKYLEGQK